MASFARMSLLSPVNGEYMCLFKAETNSAYSNQLRHIITYILNVQKSLNELLGTININDIIHLIPSLHVFGILLRFWFPRFFQEMIMLHTITDATCPVARSPPAARERWYLQCVCLVIFLIINFDDNLVKDFLPYVTRRGLMGKITNKY